jgi:uncharacterized membrane protein
VEQALTDEREVGRPSSQAMSSPSNTPCGGYHLTLMLLRRLLLVCVVSSAAPVALTVAFRILSGSSDLDFVIWNLALAWVPLVAALALDNVRSTPLALQLPLLGLWLAFFPNAPYLVTDLIHLGDPEGHGLAALLFGTVAIVALAPVGLVLAFSSLLLVERSVRERFGARIGMAASAASLLAASVGVYLGRVVRLNSWDLLSQPGEIARLPQAALVDPLAHADGLAGTLVFAGLLAVCYAVFRRVAEAPGSQALRRPPRTPI